MRRVVESEIRLAYHDRIMQTLPDAMLAEGAGVISSEPPEPVWPYEKSCGSNLSVQCLRADET